MNSIREKLRVESIFNPLQPAHFDRTLSGFQSKVLLGMEL